MYLAYEQFPISITHLYSRSKRATYCVVPMYIDKYLLRVFVKNFGGVVSFLRDDAG